MRTARVVLLASVLAVAFLAGGASLVAQTSKRPGPESRVVDPKAISMLQAMDAAFAGAQGLSATYKSEVAGRSGESMTLKLGRPNVYRLEFTNGRRIVSNGTSRFDVSGNRCTNAVVAPLNDTREIDTFNPLYWSFYDLGQWQIRSAMLGHWVTKWRLADPGLRTVTYIGREDLAGTPVDVIEWTYTISYNRPGDDPVYTTRIAIGPDHFPRRIDTESSSKANYPRTVETITDIKTLPKPALSEFAFAPPAGTSCPKVNQEDEYITGNYKDLPIGSKAPDFTLKTARGETIRLSTFLTQHKVVLMNYWGYG